MVERLPEAGHVAVAENRPDAGEQRFDPAVDIDPLGGKVFDEGLGRGQKNGLFS